MQFSVAAIFSLIAVASVSASPLAAASGSAGSCSTGKAQCVSSKGGRGMQFDREDANVTSD